MEYNKTATLTFWDAPYGSLRVEKRSDTGDASPAPPSRSSTSKPGETRTDQTRNGVAFFDQLPPGGWEVQEVAGIEGWIADTDTVQTVAVAAGGKNPAPASSTRSCPDCGSRNMSVGP